LRTGGGCAILASSTPTIGGNRVIDYATYYSQRCEEASKNQGIDLLVEELNKLGIEATSEQTGGFTMCAYIELTGNKYIYANTYGAGIYDEEDFIEDIYLNESEGDDLARTLDVAQGVAKWIQENK
jgi:hypothetical protein